MPRSKRLNKGDETLVRVAHVIDPHNFYVRLIDDDDWVVTFQELAKAHTPSKFFLGSLPKLGQLVLLEHPRHGWARGAIVRVSKNGSCYVRSLDYGDVSTVNFNELRRLDFGDATLPKAIHCCLHMCYPKKGAVWGDSSIQTFIDYLGVRPVTMTVMDRMTVGDQLSVEINSGWPETVSKLMVMAEVACFGNFPQELSISLQGSVSRNLETPHFVYDSLEFGKETNVQVLKIKGPQFYAVKSQRSDMYLSIYEMLEVKFEECATLKDHEIVVGMPVICKLTRRALDHYFRGEVKKIKLKNEKQLKIFLVDLGDYETIYATDDNLRKCDSQLLEVPTFAITCVLNEKQKLSKAICAFLTPGISLFVRKENKEDSSHIVEILDESLPKTVK